MAKTYKAIGAVTAYAIAVKYGYTGTEKEWADELIEAGKAGGYAEQAAQSASDAEDAKDDAENAKDEAEAMLSVITSEFNSSVTYPVGSYCFHEGNMYECVVEHTGAWNGSHFSQAVVGEQLADLRMELDDTVSDVADVKSDLSKVGLSDEAKEALLACFRNVAWASDQGQTYYDALEEALSEDTPKTLLSITAVFNQGTNTIYTDDSLDTLKQYLTVTAHYDDNTDAVVTTYALSGNLVEGTNTVTVSYGDKTTTFTVTVVDFYNISTWDFANASELNMIRNDFYAASGFTVSGGYRPSCGDAGKTRTNFNVTKGKDGAYLVDQNNSGAEIVPHVFLIPVPPTATTLTFTITPSTQYASMRSWIYNGNGNWTRESETGWKQGTGTLIRTAQANRYVSLNCKPANDGSVVYNDTTYPVPSAVFNFT